MRNIVTMMWVLVRKILSAGTSDVLGTVPSALHRVAIYSSKNKPIRGPLLLLTFTEEETHTQGLMCMKEAGPWQEIIKCQFLFPFFYNDHPLLPNLLFRKNCQRHEGEIFLIGRRHRLLGVTAISCEPWADAMFRGWSHARPHCTLPTGLSDTTCCVFY